MTSSIDMMILITVTILIAYAFPQLSAHQDGISDDTTTIAATNSKLLKRRTNETMIATITTNFRHNQTNSSFNPPSSIKRMIKKGRICNEATEFSCQSDRRCIPIEWRCDFIEQCLDGQDELGCSPEWCSFEHSLCNWSNHFSQYDDQEVSFLRAERRAKPAFWRRYLPWVRKCAKLNATIIAPKSQRSEVGLNSRPTMTRSSLYSSESSSCMLLGQIMKQLRAEPEQESDFLFAPLHVFHLRGQQHETSEALLRAPLIGQTNSMCQLRFRYTTWSTKTTATSIAGDEHSSVGQQFRIKLSVNLIARSSQNEREMDNNNKHSQQQQREKRSLWSKSIESFRDSRNGTNLPRWQVEVVELGHLRQTELEFVAKAILVRADDNKQPAKARDWLEKAKIELDDQTTPQFAAFVAIDWLRFQGCAWPQGINLEALLSGRQSKTGVSAEKEKKYVSVDNDDEDDDNDNESDSSVGESDFAAVASGACQWREFQCSNGVCLDEQRLCNFVDDCMSRNEEDEETVEDEADDLCSAIVGMESFEQRRKLPTRRGWLNDEVGEKEEEEEEGWSAIHDHQRQRRQERQQARQSGRRMSGSLFWRLSGSWPEDKVKIKGGQANDDEADSLEGSERLDLAGRNSPFPRMDHTLRSREGHYLSLEIPMGGKNLSWIYLSSPWLQQLDDDCRVKFFYNFVAEGGALLSQTQASASAEDSNRQQPKVYLAVEHHTLNLASSKLNKFGHFTNKKVDSLLHSHIMNSQLSVSLAERSAPIELVGLDFWREANFKLEKLNEGDLFYISIVVIVEPSESNNSNYALRASLNIDDLSTHFGCAFAEDPEKLKATNGTKRNFSEKSFSLGDYISKIAPTPDALPKHWRALRQQQHQCRGLSPDNQPVQFEPQKLIVLVVGVLASFFGMISIIVFLLVPYVERITMGYYDQLNLGLIEVETPRNSMASLVNECELISASGLAGGNVPGWHSRRELSSISTISAASTSGAANSSGSWQQRQLLQPKQQPTISESIITSELMDGLQRADSLCGPSNEIRNNDNNYPS